MSAEELARIVLGRAETLAELNLFTALDPEQVLRAARHVDRQRSNGAVLGPLAGVPLIVKDNIDSADLPTTAASTAFAGWRPTRNASVLARLLDAGAILLGKANMHEMALGTTSNNPVYGPVRNPYAPGMIAGGSSGGTAAAIAANVVSIGLGTDTGGSCRVPAALCGCVGFRPSFGRYASTGIIPLTWTLDTPGPLGRTVDDVRLVDQACTGQPSGRPPITLAGTRLAAPPSLYEDLDPELETVVRGTLDKLREAGVALIDADIAELRHDPIDDRQAPSAVAGYLLRHGSRRSAIDAFEQVSGRVEREMLLAQVCRNSNDPSPFIQTLSIERPAYQQRVAQYFSTHDVTAILMPTTPLPARPIGQDETVTLNNRPVPTFATYLRNTGFGSGAGLPSLSIPAGLTSSGLPVGLEIVGAAHADACVLAIGKAIESLTGWVGLAPP